MSPVSPSNSPSTSASPWPPWKAYLDEVSPDGLDARLKDHGTRVTTGLTRLAEVGEDRAGVTYAPGKWSVRQVVGHLVVSHRIFVTRAVCIARGEARNLPGYDENAYADGWPYEGVTLAALARAYAAEAAATLAWLPLWSAADRAREGVANGTRVTPDQLLRALIGHELHHFSVLRDRYGLDILT
ncbi:MAG TPA: DinB family protein [Fibrobacteria bacterium]|jgi:uncharacterized damage-inducible protein DinB|nr:DinB family protein [Fibrobacteria bacterium]